MCYSRRIDAAERDKRFEEELRYLADRERKRPEPPVPVVENDETEPVAEPRHEEVFATRT